LALAISATSIAIAGDDPAHERHEMMEGVRDAAKPVGAMLKGEKEFDADTLQRSLATFAKASEKLGDARRPRARRQRRWRGCTCNMGRPGRICGGHPGAVDANPQSLDAAKPVVGPVFGACKNCHDSYRIEED
jgi:cytochrome c556